MTSKRLVFFGNERLATGVSTDVPVLRALIDAGYDIRAVVSHNEVTRSRKQRDLEIAAVADEAGIPLLLPHKLGDIYDELIALEAEAAVLVAYGKIVPQRVIDIFPRGIINIHPSALPKHRGPTPLESVILDGSTTTSVSLMALAAAMDAGPVYAQQSVELTGTETKQQLADKLITVGRDMVIEHLPGILEDSVQPTIQDDSQASYDQLITKRDGIIDWQQPALVLERQIRAYADWPKSRTNIGGYDVAITAAHVIDGSGIPGVVWLQDRQLGMHTGDGILVIDSLVPAGKKPMSGSDFLRGYKPKTQ